ncbi:MAG: radical SAM protein [Alphaproteobacteria bacterium]
MNVSVDLRPTLNPLKFQDPDKTLTGETRASVALRALETLWINTGTLCNIACRGCYIESSPRNDRLTYISCAEVQAYLDEIARDRLPVAEVGLTGGEPFMNPEIMPILDLALARGFRVLVLTNAMRPMERHRARLLDLKNRFQDRLLIRVSLDHYEAERHDHERGDGSYARTLDGVRWLVASGFRVAIAARTIWNEPPWNEPAESLRAGFGRLFAREGWPIQASNPQSLVLFPEMEQTADVPEITTACWGILNRSPDEMMCASSRMVVKRIGAKRPAVVACTLLPYDARFEMGATLAEAATPVKLNHPHCAKFCVLGGGRCS